MRERYSYSIDLGHDLTTQIFPPATKNRLLDPSEIPALDFASEFPQFENWSVSATIGINWSICGDIRQNPRIAFIEKRPSALAAMMNWMKIPPSAI
jgi:hypothetical protein